MVWLPLRFNVAAAFQRQFDVFQTLRLLAMASDRSQPFLVDALGLDGGVIVGLSKMDLVGFLMDVVSNPGYRILATDVCVTLGAVKRVARLAPSGAWCWGRGSHAVGEPCKGAPASAAGFCVKDFKKS